MMRSFPLEVPRAVLEAGEVDAARIITASGRLPQQEPVRNLSRGADR